MKRLLKFEWNRMIQGRAFKASLLITTLFIALHIFYNFYLEIKGYNNGASLYNRWLGVFPLFFSGSYFFMSLPILTSMAYSWSISYDRGSGFISQIITRTSKNKYFIAKYLISFLSGGIVFVFALILDYLFLATFIKNIIPSPTDLTTSMDPFHFCSQLYYSKPLFFCILWLITAFLWGGAMASICASVGVFIRKKVVVIIIPLIIFISQSIIMNYIAHVFNIRIKGGYVLELVWNNMLYTSSGRPSPTDIILSNIFFILFVSTVIYIVRCRKYECL